MKDSAPGFRKRSSRSAGCRCDAEGCEKFSVTFKDGKVDVMNYRRAPLDVDDDPDAMQRWAALAVEAGARSAAKGKPRSG